MYATCYLLCKSARLGAKLRATPYRVGTDKTGLGI